MNLVSTLSPFYPCTCFIHSNECTSSLVYTHLRACQVAFYYFSCISDPNDTIMLLDEVMFRCLLGLRLTSWLHSKQPVTQHTGSARSICCQRQRCSASELAGCPHKTRWKSSASYYTASPEIYCRLQVMMLKTKNTAKSFTRKKACPYSYEQAFCCLFHSVRKI